MKKIYHTYRWIVFLFFTFLCSCTNEDNNQVLFLKQIVEVSADGTSNTTVLNYNGNKIASIDNVEMHSDFYYTANLITKIVKFDKVEKHSNTLEYNYNNGELVKIISSDNYVINYVHNNDGTVSYEKVTKDANNNDIIVFHGMLYFQSGNIIKSDTILDDITTTVLTKKSLSIEYDSRNNALHNILGFSKLLDYTKLISASNSVILTETDELNYSETDQITSSIKIYTSQYKYDSKGYPVEILSERSLFGTTNAKHIKSLLFYK